MRRTVKLLILTLAVLCACLPVFTGCGNNSENIDDPKPEPNPVHTCEKWNDTVLNEPTSSSEGSAQRVCAECGKKSTVTLPVLGEKDYDVLGSLAVSQGSCTTTFAITLDGGNNALTFAKTAPSTWFGSYYYSGAIASNKTNTVLSAWDMNNWKSGADAATATKTSDGAIKFAPDTENGLSGMGSLAVYSNETATKCVIEGTSRLMRNTSDAQDAKSKGKSVTLDFLFKAEASNGAQKDFKIGLYGEESLVWNNSGRAPLIIRYDGEEKIFEGYRKASGANGAVLTWTADASAYSFDEYTKISLDIGKSSDGSKWNVKMRVNDANVPFSVVDGLAPSPVETDDGSMSDTNPGSATTYLGGDSFFVRTESGTTCYLTVSDYVYRDTWQGEEKLYLYGEGKVPYDADNSTREYVFLTPYLAKSPTGGAVIVMPGGGYNNLSNSTNVTTDGSIDRCVNNKATQKEASAIAKWYNARGISVFVLNYRTKALNEPSYNYYAPMSDALRAVRYVRYYATVAGGRYKNIIDPDKIAVQGGSAGGHLAAMTLTNYDWPTAAKYTAGGTVTIQSSGVTPDDIDAVSAKPNAAILAYAVISFDDSVTHKGSKTNFLGSNPSDALCDLYSANKQVTADTAPTFLWHHEKDSGVKSQNTVLMRDALDAAGVKNECHIFNDNNYTTHGIGAAFDDPLVAGSNWIGKLTEAERWPIMATAFLKDLNF